MLAAVPDLFDIPPAGVSAASIGGDAAFADPADPPGILADAIDPMTGDLRSLLERVDPVDAKVQFQLQVRRGSGASVLEDGQDFASVMKNDSRAAAALEHEARRALEPLRLDGDIEDVRVVVQAGEGASDAGEVVVSYANSRTGRAGAGARARARS